VAVPQVDRKTPLQRKAEKPFWVLLTIILFSLSFLILFYLIEVATTPFFIPNPADKALFYKALEKVGGVFGYLTDKLLAPFKVLDRNELWGVKTIDRLMEKYPFPTLWTLISGKSQLTLTNVAVVIAELITAVITALGLFFFDFKVLKPFFFRSAEKEPPLSLGRDWPVDLEKITGMKNEEFASYFKGRMETLDEVMKVLDGRIPRPNNDDPTGVIRTESEKVEREERAKGRIVFNRKRIAEMVRDYTEKLTDFGLALRIIKPEEVPHFKAIMGFTLFHHVLDFFGGMPTGFLTPRIADYTFKRVISTYSFRDKVPLVKFGNTVYENEEQPARFLTVLHGYCREKEDVYETLKEEFCQIPGWDELVPIKRKLS